MSRFFMVHCVLPLTVIY